MMTQNQQTFLEKNSVVIKLASIGFLALILLIPMAMIMSLVTERQKRLDEATLEVSSKWGFEQRVTGPILSVPFNTYEYDSEKKTEVKTRHLAYFLPENLNISGEMNPEVRYRGIFQVAVYSANLSFNGNFKKPTFDSESKQEILWDEAFVTLGISDLRGIKESIKFVWNAEEKYCDPGVKINNVESGITVNGVIKMESELTDYNFSFNISLNGSKGLSFVPVGKETTANISSTWQTPNFDGAFLPENRKISQDGFDAQWHVLELNRNYPQRWADRKMDLAQSAFGVSLLLPVDTYQITERSMKYAILFISLTFMVFFFVEVLRKMKVHPIQYVLVGFGLVLFYLLLLSLSEHIAFELAYIVASTGIVALITGYSISIFWNKQLTLTLASIMILLYGFLYILLQMQDYALLMGSVGLFIILSTVMYLSRKIDWYSIGGVEKGD